MVLTILIAVFLITGMFFGFIGVLGILRMPDVYGRLQASTCIATMSTICVNTAGILYVVQNGMNTGTAVKIFLMMLLVLVTNPISNHALCKAAYAMGVKPAKPFEIDDLKEDLSEDPPEDDAFPDVPGEENGEVKA